MENCERRLILELERNMSSFAVFALMLEYEHRYWLQIQPVLDASIGDGDVVLCSF